MEAEVKLAWIRRMKAEKAGSALADALEGLLFAHDREGTNDGLPGYIRRDITNEGDHVCAYCGAPWFENAEQHTTDCEILKAREALRLAGRG